MANTSPGTADPVIEEILRRLPIEEYIGRHVKLKPPNSKHEMSGVCPFHNDKSPSMSVNTARGLFHCKGCDARGNVLQFAQKINNMGFRDVKLMLAEELGIKVEAAKPLEGPLKLLDAISQQFKQALPKNAALYKYATEERGLKPETLARFGIGFCTGQEFYKSSEAQIKELTEVGVMMPPREPGRKPWSLMSGRLTFTIKGRDGKVIAFGGRKVDETRQGPKYLNTADSKYFNKSEVLFGMYEASAAIYRDKFALVVEGYMDVAILHQEGVQNSVGVMGASASEKAFEYLWSKTKRIVFCLDPDKAGTDGTVRSIMRAASSMKDDCRIDIISLPDEQDPDEFVLKHGASAIQDLCNQAMPLSRFLGEQMRNREHAEGRGFVLRIPEDRTRYLMMMKEVAAQFTQAPNLQKEIVAGAEAMLSAFVCDAALKQRNISASPDEIRAALEMLSRIEASHSTPRTETIAAPERTAPKASEQVDQRSATSNSTMHQPSEDDGTRSSNSQFENRSTTEYEINTVSRPAVASSGASGTVGRRVSMFKQ